MNLFENFKDVNYRWFNRYIKLVNYYKSYEGCGEKHHILPSSLFPEFSKVKENIQLFPHRVHFLLHYILFKMLMDKEQRKSMIFAFNMMRRTGINSTLYKANRELISNTISDSNKNRKIYNNGIIEIRLKNEDIIPGGFTIGLLQEGIERRRFFAKNFAIVKINNKNEVISRSDQNYILGVYDDCRVGKKHSIETKTKMSNNGIKGKVAYSNEEGDVIFTDNINIPEGFVRGNIISKNTCTFNVSKLHYHNPITNKNIRLKEGDIPPEGFIKGRGFFNKTKTTTLVTLK